MAVARPDDGVRDGAIVGRHAGVETIVHCAGNAIDDVVITQNLVRAASAAGRMPHLVCISVVGADRVPVSGVDRLMFGHFAAKRGAERVGVDSGLPWTVLPATQFYDLMLLVARALTRLPVVPIPARFLLQPVNIDEVAARLVGPALGEPAGLLPDVGGPRTYAADDLIRAYLRTGRRQRRIMPVWLPARAASAIRNGALVVHEGEMGSRTWEALLTDAVK